ncbi:GNAT family N-acetyltransferase [Liberiplasma polymorphum]|uniref:GNAT family N-acetyltransferase n=1 Tax=Liberiplasma polymorphum TaxID=3374570 RepID=UPI00377286DD
MDILFPLLSLIIAILSLSISFILAKKGSETTSYLNIDKQYSDLLRIALDYTDLRRHQKTIQFYKEPEDSEFRARYNVYAYMTWNLIETIFDMQKDKEGRFNLSSTWLPVMFEENRLHYSWFKHNIKLFKTDFQNFVTSELNDIEMIVGTVNDLADVYKSMLNNFPKHELKSQSHIEVLMHRNNYRLLLARHKVFNQIIGFAFVYENQNHDFVWLDYMAIDPLYQNAGYGTLLFNKLLNMIEEKHYGIYLEVEIPNEEDQKYIQQLSRIRFYKRLGVNILSDQYVFPNNLGGEPMYLCFKPLGNLNNLPKDQIKKAVMETFDFIHGDVEMRHEHFKRFMPAISDVKF